MVAKVIGAGVHRCCSLAIIAGSTHLGYSRCFTPLQATACYAIYLVPVIPLQFPLLDLLTPFIFDQPLCYFLWCSLEVDATLTNLHQVKQ